MNGPEESGGLRFFGAIAASVSHELNNIMTIVDQVNGLLQDLLVSSQAGRPIKMEQLNTIHERIARQTGRGVEIVHSLNRFAHGIDEPSLAFELNSALRILLALVRHILDLKKVKLRVQYFDDDITVIASPFGIQQLVFHCLQEFMRGRDEAPEISVSVSRENSLAVIAISGPGIKFAPPATRGEAKVRDDCRDGRSMVRIELPLLRQAGGET